MSTVLTDDQVKANIAANIRRLRGSHSLRWLSNQVGTYPITIKRIEDMDQMAPAGLLARLAEVLDTTVDELISPHARKIAKRG